MPSDPRALEDAVALVASQAATSGAGLTRTKLIKLLYFVDLRSWEELGRVVTGVEWTWWRYGPYSATIVEACNRMSSAGELEVVQTHNYYGSAEYRIHSVKPMYFEPPGARLTAVVRAVVREFGSFSPTKIGDLSYETQPMRNLVARGGTRGDLIEFPVAPPSERDVASVAVKYRHHLLRRRRSDEGEVGAGLRSELEDLDLARRAAGSRVLHEP